MSTLVEFLTARLAEDEAAARAAVETPGAEGWHWVRTEDDAIASLDTADEYFTEGGDVSLRSVADLRQSFDGRPLPDFIIWSVDDMLRVSAAAHIARHDPARVLAEVAAHREIVERLAAVIGDEPPQSTLDEEGWELLAWETLQDLAGIYADHPDFKEWVL